MDSAAGTTHHPDCDGYRTLHRVYESYAVSESGGVTLYAFACGECGILHPGLYREDAVKEARREHMAHARRVPCDGRCGEPM